jgi:glycerol-3-phosphate dehydrogenase
MARGEKSCESGSAVVRQAGAGFGSAVQPLYDNRLMEQQDSDSWADRPLDVLVIGGGIVGAGVARDAAMRGLRVGLVEQNDFASGTSGRSTRLLHGGLRYLAQGRIGLVREAGREKRILQRIAPHLSQTQRFVFPTYRHTDWPKWRLRLGVKVYDWLCGGGKGGASGAMGAARTRQLLPQLNDADLTGAVYYNDALTNDARLVLDTLGSAGRHGALLRNYTRFAGAQRKEDFWECRLEPRDGEAGAAKARCIVNATGPWSDQLPNSRIKLRLTKGVHLVLSTERFSVPEAIVLTQRKRILFAIPWGQRVYIGTTDTDYSGPVESPGVTTEDVAYLLEIFNHAFPEAGLTPEDILSDWAGVRPLIADPKGRPSDISRTHEIIARRDGWIDVAGGKLTTYRLIAQQVVDKALWHTGRSTLPCATADEPLLMGKAIYSGILPPPVCREAVEYYCRHEWVVRLEDIMLRRAGWHQYFGSAPETVRQVGQWMGEVLGWDAAGVEREIAAYGACQSPEGSLPE